MNKKLNIKIHSLVGITYYSKALLLAPLIPTVPNLIIFTKIRCITLAFNKPTES